MASGFSDAVILIHTDAALDTENGMVAYAFIADNDRQSLRLSLIKNHVMDVNDAEQHAISFAVAYATTLWPLAESATVITDSCVATRRYLSDVEKANSIKLSVVWQPRRSTDRMREVDDMARFAIRNSRSSR